jgi:hypothetical protein
VVWLSTPVLLAVFAFAFSVNAQEMSLEDAAMIYQMQAERLERQSRATCPKDYAGIYAGKEVNISVFHGYSEQKEEKAYTAKETIDGDLSQALKSILTGPCKGAMAACGFRTTLREKNFARLEKTIGGKRVILKVQSTSVSKDHLRNSAQDGLYWEQQAMSKKVLQRFHQALRNDDVVFYSGHARGGGGALFEIQFPAQIAINYIFRAPVQPMLQAARAPESRLKLLGIFACKSTQNYTGLFNRANPGLRILSSDVDILMPVAEQALLGALHAVLGRKCAAQAAQSIMPAPQVVPANDQGQFNAIKVL